MFTDAAGDNDPIDAIEVGSTAASLPMGTITRAKVLGSLALIDEGETDHKIIVIREDDPHYRNINTLKELEHYNKGVVASLVHWLKYYKTSDGKGVNTLANNEVPKSADEAVAIIEEVVGLYDDLVDGNTRVDDEFYLPRSRGGRSSSSSSSSSSKSSSRSHASSADTMLSDVTDDEERR